MPNKDRRKEKEEVRFLRTLNSNLVCKDCMYNNQPFDYCVLTCDKYSPKPAKVLEGGKCEEYEKSL